MSKPWEQYQEESAAPWERYARPQLSEEEKERIRQESEARIAQIQQDMQNIERPSLLGEIGEEIAGTAETAATMGTGFAGTVLGGASGLLHEGLQELGLASDELSGADVVEQTQQALTYQPRTESGQRRLGTLASLMQPYQDLEEYMGESGVAAAEQVGADPAFMYALNKTVLNAFPEIFAIKGLSSLKKGTTLIDDFGNPTKELKKVLDDQGLVYESLSPESLEAIPKQVNNNLIALGKAKTNVADNVVKQQLKAGARDDALHSFRLINDKVVPDKLGVRTVKQGFEPNVVQMVKTSTPETRLAMKEALNIMERFKKNAGIEARPSDVAGNAVSSRLKFVRNKANKAREKLDNIAKNQLANETVDLTPVTQAWREALNDLDIDLPTVENGKAVIDFKGSIISKNKASQKVLKDAVDLLGETAGTGTKANALKVHKLKKKLDDLIDFKAKSKQGLPESGRKVLKQIRASLNDVLRKSNKGYAEANDTISQSLKVIEKFQEAFGKDVDIFDVKADAAIGQELRKLLSNYKVRTKMEKNIGEIADLAESFGGNFKVNPRDLIVFSNALDSRFGHIAKSSLGGIMEDVTKKAARGDIQGGILDLAAEEAVKGSRKARGITDFEAFRAMEDLLDRGQ